MKWDYILWLEILVILGIEVDSMCFSLIVMSKFFIWCMIDGSKDNEFLMFLDNFFIFNWESFGGIFMKYFLSLFGFVFW